MSKIYIVAPSHLHSTFMESSVSDDFTTNGVIPISSLGPPNFSFTTKNALEKAYSFTQKDIGSKMVWMVIDWRIGNYDIGKIKQDKLELFFDTPAKPSNIDASFINEENDTYLINHQLRVIDKVIHEYPDIKLIFWCLYFRTKVCNTNIPQFGRYDEIMNRYKNNTIDISKITNTMSVNDVKLLYKDAGGHPSISGYRILLDLIRTC